MARKNSRSDLITGAFALLVIVCFVAVIMFLQAVGTKVEGVRYVVVFDDIGGLGSNANVIVAGQRVGKVDYIRTLPIVSSQGARSVEVEVGIIIQEDYAESVIIPVDTVAQVQMGGFFGGNQMVLNLGKARDTVKPGQRLPEKGRRPIDFNTLLESAERTMTELETGLKKVADLLKDDAFTGNIRESLITLNSALKKLDDGLLAMEPAFTKVGPTLTSTNELLDQIKSLIDKNDEQITNVLKNLESATGKFDALMSNEEQGVPRLVGSLNTIADTMDELLANLNDVVLDNQLNIQISLQNIREASASIRTFARRIERDPSLLIWGDSEDEKRRAELDGARPTPNVDEMEIRNSGRRPRKESD